MRARTNLHSGERPKRVVSKTSGMQYVGCFVLLSIVFCLTTNALADLLYSQRGSVVLLAIAAMSLGGWVFSMQLFDLRAKQK